MTFVANPKGKCALNLDDKWDQELVRSREDKPLHSLQEASDIMEGTFGQGEGVA